MELTGLHHVSGMTADAPANLRFYTQELGLRLVKKTVNQDNPSSYHLFYADAVGNAGTNVTFFELLNLGRNRPGVGTVSNVALRVGSAAALRWWRERFEARGLSPAQIRERAGRESFTFEDPEGQSLQLVVDDGAPGTLPWTATVPGEVALQGLGPVSLTVSRVGPTAALLTEHLGFREMGSYDDPEAPKHPVYIFAAGAGGVSAELHLHERPELPHGQLGRGGMHHVAFRVPTDEDHRAWLEHLQVVGVSNSGLIDRFYFRSLYFREPNGVLFELATDGPGFTTDEDPAHLGERLALPPFLEAQRARIEANLRPLSTSQSERV